MDDLRGAGSRHDDYSQRYKEHGMSKHYYTDEKNAQIVIALLKAHGIRDMVISPGATNDVFVLSVQGDPDFNLYSAVDERHAGYLACGIAQESGKPVVINCTGATASRNYMSALTEAYYRKLPILAITCSQHSSHIGNMYPQMTDRIHLPSDIVNLSVQCPIPHTDEELRDCELKVNRAILELTHRGGGPVHINLETSFNGNYTVETLPKVRRIRRVMPTDTAWPSIDTTSKVMVWVGSHRPFSESEKATLSSFLKSNNAVVIGDITSNYDGIVRASELCYQKGSRINPDFSALKPNLIIHIGEISGDYATFGWLKKTAPVWRVSEDGELRDFLGGLEMVFEMPEETFFSHYARGKMITNDYGRLWVAKTNEISALNTDLEFSAMWIAKTLSPKIPADSNIHLGILNPLRCWDMTGVNVMHGFSTVGGFGIDGGTSSMIGASLANPDRLNFGVFGDLSFFYDLNSLGSRHIGKNLRLLVINNGEGGEFLVPGNVYENANCGERVHDYISARGHFGVKSPVVVKHFAEDLGFKYISASTKDEFCVRCEEFVRTDIDKSIIFECFTTAEGDRKALDSMRHKLAYEDYSVASGLKSVARAVLPTGVRGILKTVIKG